MSSSVQFYGIDAVATAYEQNNCPAWGLFAGRQLLCKYKGTDIKEGVELLDKFLQQIEHSNALYTLKVFEPDEKKGLIIKENTPCDGSFNFRLVEKSEYEERAVQRSGYNSALLSEVQAMREEIKELREGDQDEDNSVMGRIGNLLLEDPAKIPMIIGAINSVINMFKTTNTATAIPETPQLVYANANRPVTIAGINDDAALALAIEKLKQHDPKITEHLQKLAKIAESDKAGFQSLLTVLDNINV